jgi:hypothetical protein
MGWRSIICIYFNAYRGQARICGLPGIKVEIWGTQLPTLAALADQNGAEFSGHVSASRHNHTNEPSAKCILLSDIPC